MHLRQYPPSPKNVGIGFKDTMRTARAFQLRPAPDSGLASSSNFLRL
jgi:hypothetical protein